MKVSLSIGLSVLSMILVLGVVTAQQDTEPPHLVSLSLTPGQVDVSNGDREIVATAHLTDDISGLADVPYSPSQIRFRSPSQQQFVTFVFNSISLISGTELDGIHVDTVIVPQYAEAGLWEAEYIVMADDAGNWEHLDVMAAGSAGFPMSFEVVSQMPDTTPPALVSFDYEPRFIDTSADTQVTFTVRFTDDLSGLSDAGLLSQARFRSPSQDDFVDAIFMPPQLVSGDHLDGTYVDVVTVPAGSENGVWGLEYFLAYDNVGNHQYFFSPADSDPAGSLRMPYLVMINRPPLPIWLPIIGR